MIFGQGLAGHAVGCLRARPYGLSSVPAPVNRRECAVGDGWLVVV
jgi:hypothetical protein